MKWKPPIKKYHGRRDVIKCMAKLGVIAYNKFCAEKNIKRGIEK
jgi:hypothetical protein